uniref:Uncharacterized protein n=1 Tax=viral metagenome TaxID=1070528 RepID=A0A6M3LAL8_9ZZZZ
MLTNEYNELCHTIRNVSTNLAGISKKIAKCSNCNIHISEINTLCNRLEQELNKFTKLFKHITIEVVDGQERIFYK